MYHAHIGMNTWQDTVGALTLTSIEPQKNRVLWSTEPASAWTGAWPCPENQYGDLIPAETGPDAGIPMVAMATARA